MSEWISVEDRLPKPHVGVIIAREVEPGKPLRVESATLRGNGYWKVYGTNVKKGVFYWMPLPEPPEVKRC